LVAPWRNHRLDSWRMVTAILLKCHPFFVNFGHVWKACRFHLTQHTVVLSRRYPTLFGNASKIGSVTELIVFGWCTPHVHVICYRPLNANHTAVIQRTRVIDMRRVQAVFFSAWPLCELLSSAHGESFSRNTCFVHFQTLPAEEHETCDDCIDSPIFCA
jgi:hypothetical protein